MILIDPETNKITGLRVGDVTYQIAGERCEIHPAQRFDRDAVKAMLVDAMNRAAMSPDFVDVFRPGRTIVVMSRLEEEPTSVEFDAEDFADTVLEWFGGKGAA